MKTVVKEVVIEAKGTFDAYYEATNMLRQQGYTLGSMCGNEPIGFADGDEYGYVAKWHNLNPSDRKMLDGVIVPNHDFRDGGVIIKYFNLKEGI